MDSNCLANATQEIIDLLEKNEWIQGRSYKRIDSRSETSIGFCVVGAAYHVYYQNLLDVDGGNWYREFSNFLINSQRTLTHNIPGWNDAQGRTKEEILETLRDFMAELKGRNEQSVTQ